MEDLRNAELTTASPQKGNRFDEISFPGKYLLENIEVIIPDEGRNSQTTHRQSSLQERRSAMLLYLIRSYFIGRIFVMIYLYNGIRAIQKIPAVLT